MFSGSESYMYNKGTVSRLSSSEPECCSTNKTESESESESETESTHLECANMYICMSTYNMKPYSIQGRREAHPGKMGAPFSPLMPFSGSESHIYTYSVCICMYTYKMKAHSIQGRREAHPGAPFSPLMPSRPSFPGGPENRANISIHMLSHKTSIHFTYKQSTSETLPGCVIHASYRRSNWVPIFQYTCFHTKQACTTSISNARLKHFREASYRRSNGM